MRQSVVGAPRYDPELVDRRYLDDLYSHYGYVPYWGPGYVYSPYPSYPYFL